MFPAHMEFVMMIITGTGFWVESDFLSTFQTECRKATSKTMEEEVQNEISMDLIPGLFRV